MAAPRPGSGGTYGNIGGGIVVNPGISPPPIPSTQSIYERMANTRYGLPNGRMNTFDWRKRFQPGYENPDPYATLNKPPKVNVYEGLEGFKPLIKGDALGGYQSWLGGTNQQLEQLNNAALAYRGMSQPQRQSLGIGYGEGGISNTLKKIIQQRLGGL